LVDFALEDVDVAVRFGSGPFAGLHAQSLMLECIVPVSLPELAKSISSPNGLLGYTLLHDESHDGNPGFPDWETWLLSHGVAVEAPLRVRHFGDTNLTIQAAMSGLGIALAWHSLVVDELRAGRLAQLFGSTFPTDQGYHLVMPPNRADLPKVIAFKDWLLEQAHVKSK
jgi:LysR family glycine cleavage system transcriptional activator